MHRHILFLFAGAVALAGCGPVSPCDRISAVGSTLTARRGSCAITITVGAKASCDSAYASGLCRPSDEASHHRAFDCLERLPVCTPGTELAWLAQFNACTAPSSLSCRF